MTPYQRKSSGYFKKIIFGMKTYGGTDLLSHNLADAVPLALEDLTAVFGMGTGVAPPA